MSWDLDRDEFNEWVAEGAWNRIWSAYEHVREERDEVQVKLDKVTDGLAEHLDLEFGAEIQRLRREIATLRAEKRLEKDA